MGCSNGTYLFQFLLAVLTWSLESMISVEGFE